MRSLVRLALVTTLLFGCDGPEEPEDAGPEPTDAGPLEPASTDHCAYEDVPATGGAGGTVEAGALTAGRAEAFLDVPLGASVGSYTARSDGFGGSGFTPDPDQRSTDLAGTFAPSIGIETIIARRHADGFDAQGLQEIQEHEVRR